jgi:hypothetical protein
VTTDSGVFFSDDSGLSWTELSLGLPSGIPVTSVEIDPNTREVLVSLFSAEDGGVYRGGNLAGMWSELNAGLAELRVRRLSRDNGHTVDADTRGTFFYAATAGDGAYRTELLSEQVAGPAVATAALAAGYLREPYTATLAATGGIPPYTWSLAAGALPAGLRLESDGRLHGQPAVAGLASFTVRVADANARTAERALTLLVHDGPLFADGFESGDTSAWFATEP